MKVQPVILSGGSGTRLWPLSREQYPKQLLTLLGEKTMLQHTARRLQGLRLPEGWALDPCVVVSNEEYRFISAEQLRGANVATATIILEPAGRNTAPALTVAALAAAEDDPVLVVMPADHVITDEAAFCRAVVEAAQLAAEGRVVTFGIVPTAPETGYGYIQCGAEIGKGPALAIARFVEKPDLATAEAYLATGDYLWNSGIFVLKASVWLEKIALFRPGILDACQRAMAVATRDQDFLRLGREDFLSSPSDSIDYAVMEHLAADDSAVLPLAAGWSDVGAWTALLEIGPQDSDGNVLTGDVMAVNTRNSLVRSESRLVACIGLTDMVVVEMPDAVLVAHRDDIQKVKEIAASLKAAGRPEYQAHRKIFRPWGYYDSIDAGSRFQVKRIVVNPGASLSLQMHFHRAEHWVVVSGTARVIRGHEEFLLGENQSTYIPLGTTHRLENPGKIPLEIVEIQSGAYLNEDDIVRHQDTYGRG
jgi:mannose-1-phosphate guanylyltransferase/mannose-6-phosphate isomerase